VVEREGLSVRHPARFVLIGTGNPEEGELRPQLLDRFGLSVEVKTPSDIETRIEVVRRRDEFDQAPLEFMQKWMKKDEAVRRSLQAARTRLPTVLVSDKARERTARLCMDLGTDGLRGELTLIRASRAIASLDGQDSVSDAHLRRAAPIALRHRLRRDPLDEVGSTARIDRVMADMFGA
jgi:magnesium chelatase subunit I